MHQLFETFYWVTHHVFSLSQPTKSLTFECTFVCKSLFVESFVNDLFLRLRLLWFIESLANEIIKFRCIIDRQSFIIESFANDSWKLGISLLMNRIVRGRDYWIWMNYFYFHWNSKTCIEVSNRSWTSIFVNLEHRLSWSNHLRTIYSLKFKNSS